MTRRNVCRTVTLLVASLVAITARAAEEKFFTPERDRLKSPTEAGAVRDGEVNGTISVPIEEYEKNLETLVTRLEKTGATLIFATTTKVPEGEPGRHAGDEAKYNEAALRVINRHGIPVNDLHALSSGFSADKFSKPGDVHFSGSGCTALAKQVASAIRQHGLGTKKPADRNGP